MRKIGNIILKIRWIVFILVILVTSILIRHVPKLKADNSIEAYLKGHKELQVYEDYLGNFRSDKFNIIAYEVDDLFTEKEMKYLAYLTDKLEEEVPHIIEVNSLTNIEDVVGTEEGLEVKDLITKYTVDKERKEYLKKRISQNPIIYGNLISKDWKTVAVVLEAEEDKETDVHVNNITTGIIQIIENEEEKTGRKFYAGGTTIRSHEFQKMTKKGFGRCILLTLVLSAIVLFVIFRRFGIVVICYIPILLSVIWTLGLIALLGKTINTTSIVSASLLVVLGLENSIHIVSYYLSVFPNYNDKKQALLGTFAHTGVPLLFTTITTVCGFMALVISPVIIIKEFALFLSFGTINSFLLVFLLVPNFLLLIRTPKDVKGAASSFIEKILEKIADFNLKNGKIILISVLIVIAVSIVGITKVKIEYNPIEWFKKNSVVRQTYDFIDSKLSGGEVIETVIKGETDSFKDPSNLKIIENLQQIAADNSNVTMTTSIVDYLKLINRALNNDEQRYFKIPETKDMVAQTYLLYEMSGGEEIKKYTNEDYSTIRITTRLRQTKQKIMDDLIIRMKKYLADNLKGFSAEFTGYFRLWQSLSGYLVDSQIRGFSLAFLSVFLMMIMLFGWKAGLASIIPNILPILVVYALMGYMGITLNIGTVILAALILGIVVNNTIHYFYHYRQQYKLTGDSEITIRESFNKVGKAMVSSSIILTLGFLVFLSDDSLIVVNFGILTAASIVAALFADLFLGSFLLLNIKVFASGKDEKNNNK